MFLLLCNRRLTATDRYVFTDFCGNVKILCQYIWFLKLNSWHSSETIFYSPYINLNVLQPCTRMVHIMWLTGLHITSQTRRVDGSLFDRRWRNSSGKDFQSHCSHPKLHNVYIWHALWWNSVEPCSYDSVRSLDMCYGLFPRSNHRTWLCQSLSLVCFCQVLCVQIEGFAIHLPVLSWLPMYNVKENLLCDVIRGVSAGTIQVPQGRSVHSFHWCLSIITSI